MVFFVISGYLVGGLVLTRFNVRGFDAISYAAHRTSRIYTVLIPALCIGGLFDLIGLHYFNGSGLYTSGAHYNTASLNFAIGNNLTFPTLIGNIFMLEDIVTARLGSNTPLWSLVYEWWYYCLFGAAIMAAIKGSYIAKVIAIICLVTMIVALPHPLIAWGLIWLLGVGAAVYAQLRYWKPTVWQASLILFLAIVISRVTSHAETSGSRDSLASFERDFGVAIGFVMLILAFHQEGIPVPMARMHERLARFSYTLYLVHMPFVLLSVCFAADIFHTPFLRQPNPAGLVAYLVILVLAIVYAWLFSIVTEARTANIRNLLLAGSRKLLRSAGPGFRVSR